MTLRRRKTIAKRCIAILIFLGGANTPVDYLGVLCSRDACRCAHLRRPFPSHMTQRYVCLVHLHPAASETLVFGVDESYRLQVRGGVATLDAATVFGALRGLETFTQLAINPGAANPLSVPVACSIKDAPRFAYRGMMMDCKGVPNKTCCTPVLDKGLASSTPWSHRKRSGA